MAEYLYARGIKYTGCKHDADGNIYFAKTSTGSIISTDSTLKNNWSTAVFYITYKEPSGATVKWHAGSDGTGGSGDVGTQTYYLQYYRPGAKYPFHLSYSSSKVNGTTKQGWISAEEFFAGCQLKAALWYYPNGLTMKTQTELNNSFASPPTASSGYVIGKDYVVGGSEGTAKLTDLWNVASLFKSGNGQLLPTDDTKAWHLNSTTGTLIAQNGYNFNQDGSSVAYVHGTTSYTIKLYANYEWTKLNIYYRTDYSVGDSVPQNTAYTAATSGTNAGFIKRISDNWFILTSVPYNQTYVDKNQTSGLWNVDTFKIQRAGRVPLGWKYGRSSQIIFDHNDGNLTLEKVLNAMGDDQKELFKTQDLTANFYPTWDRRIILNMDGGSYFIPGDTTKHTENHIISLTKNYGYVPLCTSYNNRGWDNNTTVYDSNLPKIKYISQPTKPGYKFVGWRWKKDTSSEEPSETKKATFNAVQNSTAEHDNVSMWYLRNVDLETFEYSVNGLFDEELIACWEPQGLVRIYTDEGWQFATPYVYMGSSQGWQQAIGHIYDGTDWQIGI